MGNPNLPQIDTKSVTTPPPKKLQNTGSCTGMTKIDYCTEYASVKCSQSSHFLKLQVLPGMNRPTFGPYKHRGASITDCIPELNYPLFLAPWNLCFSLANPLVLAATTAKFAATGTWSTVPQPCCLGHLPIGLWGKSVGEMKLKYVPHTGGVVDNVLSVRNLALFFESNPETDCLTKNCTLTCAWLGTISIVSSGRDEMDPTPYNPVTGLKGPSAFDMLRNACGIIMNYTGLGGTAALSALDSLVAGVQSAYESGDLMEGLSTGLKTAAGYAIGLGIAAGAGKAGGKIMGTKFGKNISAKVTGKFNALAQSNFIKAVNKLSVSVHTGTIVAGQILKSNSRFTARGSVLEWLGKRNLNRVLEGRAKVLLQARHDINGAAEISRENMRKADDLEILNRRDQELLDKVNQRLMDMEEKRAPKERLENTLRERYESMERLQNTDLKEKAAIDQKIRENIDESNKLFDIRSEVDETKNPEFANYLDKKIAGIDKDTDDLAAKSVALDEEITRRNDDMAQITDDRDILNHSIDNDLKDMANDAEVSALLSQDIESRNEVKDPLVNRYGDDYNTAVYADYKVGKINDELDYLMDVKTSTGVTAPDTKADRFIDTMQGNSPEKPEPTTKSGKVWADVTDSMDKGRQGNANTIVNWGSDAAVNDTYQGLIDGDSDVEAFKYEASSDQLSQD